MCDTLFDLRAGMSRHAADFDAAVLSAEQAAVAVEAATVVERMAGVIKAKAAARVAECRAWKGAGQRSAASHLAPHHRRQRGPGSGDPGYRTAPRTAAGTGCRGSRR